MKRVFCVILCAVTALAVCACGDQKPAPAPPAATDAQVQSDSTDNPSDSNAVLKAFMEQFDDTPTVGNKLVYKDANMTVTVHGINYATVAGPELHLTVANNFGKDITVQAPYAAVNGYMVTPELSIDVPYGKSANGNFSFSYFSLAFADITCIREIEFSLRVVETKSYTPIFKTTTISLKTSAYHEGDTESVDDSGQPAYDDHDIKIVFKGVNTDRVYSDGAELMVYMYNGTDCTVAIQTGEVSVNGYDMTSVMSCTLLPDRRAVDAVTFYRADMEEYGIDAIDSIELSFEIKDADTWETIASTDAISVELE